MKSWKFFPLFLITLKVSATDSVLPAPASKTATYKDMDLLLESLAIPDEELSQDSEQLLSYVVLDQPRRPQARLGNRRDFFNYRRLPPLGRFRGYPRPQKVYLVRKRLHPIADEFQTIYGFGDLLSLTLGNDSFSIIDRYFQDDVPEPPTPSSTTSTSTTTTTTTSTAATPESTPLASSTPAPLTPWRTRAPLPQEFLWSPLIIVIVLFSILLYFCSISSCFCVLVFVLLWMNFNQEEAIQESTDEQQRTHRKPRAQVNVIKPGVDKAYLYY
ncbi:unnamed protein product [Cyprideis torosa]|uniref:Uncharacterized protein n=1 Tax=Cyprideis torosa TaxID=163714 RepID=A0A7R8WL10_9CRUS|nr:unnamed protein product [Cyprideis torosa]CAG0903807.1 unnamed protein product [Cyprideis torosa]